MLGITGGAGFDPKVVGTIEEMLLSAFDATGRFAVTGQSDIARLVGFERQKQLMGCNDSACLAEIAGSLGVSYVASADLGKVGTRSVLTVKLIDVRKAEVAARVTRAVIDESALVDVVEEIARSLASALAGATAAAAASARPASPPSPPSPSPSPLPSPLPVATPSPVATPVPAAPPASAPATAASAAPVLAPAPVPVAVSAPAATATPAVAAPVPPTVPAPPPAPVADAPRPSVPQPPAAPAPAAPPAVAAAPPPAPAPVAPIGPRAEKYSRVVPGGREAAASMRHFALRFGLSPHLGVLGAGVELRVPYVGFAVGTGTHTVGGGLSFGSGDNSGGFYVDLHGVWVRSYLLELARPGIAGGLTLGWDWRFVPWLSVKTGVGAAVLFPEPLALDMTRVKPGLVYDFAVGPVF